MVKVVSEIRVFWMLSTKLLLAQGYTYRASVNIHYHLHCHMEFGMRTVAANATLAH